MIFLQSDASPMISLNSDNLFRLFQLLISLGALVGIVWLFLKYCVNHRQSTTQTSDPSAPNTRSSRWIHTLYLGGIATFIILEFIVYVVLNNDEKDNIIDTISFGATLSSLILSVVAIIFTIVQGRNGESQLGQITQATEELRTTASALVGFKDIADNINTHIVDFQTQISDSIGNLHQSLNDKISQMSVTLDDVRDKTAELRKHQVMVQNQTKASPTNVSNSAFSAENYAMMGSYAGAVSLLTCCYAFQSQSKKRVNFNEISSAFTGVTLDYVSGYIVSSFACRAISFEGFFPEITITGVIDGLQEACMSKIKNFLSSPMSETTLDQCITNINIIRNYFGLEHLKKEDIL